VPRRSGHSLTNSIIFEDTRGTALFGAALETANESVRRNVRLSAVIIFRYEAVMLVFRNQTVVEVAACICDRCQRRMSPEDDSVEWHERLSISFRGGYGSIFGDGHSISLDLCQRCVQETLGEWLQISPGSDFELPT
jgi:hypothetical protein